MDWTWAARLTGSVGDRCGPGCAVGTRTLRQPSTANKEDATRASNSRLRKLAFRYVTWLRLRNDLYCVEWGVKLYSSPMSRDLTSNPRTRSTKRPTTVYGEKAAKRFPVSYVLDEKKTSY